MLFLWTMVVGSSYIYNAYQEQRQIAERAKIDAVVSYEKDLLYRTWSSQHGGTYVPITAETPPNPYLANVKERDITTPSGVRLTLINPAYMTRQVNELAKNLKMKVNSHMTSLKPIRPENAADPWETQALLAFEKGIPEVTAVVGIENQKYLRLMRPFIVEKDCLKCHAHQGYKVGEVRGGLSVTVDLRSFLHETEITTRRFLVIHSAVWGMGIFFGIIYRRQRLQKEAEIELTNKLLQEKEHEIEVQYKNLQHTNQQLKNMNAQQITQTSKLETVSLHAAEMSHEITKLLQILKDHCLPLQVELQKEKRGPALEKIIKQHDDTVEKITKTIKHFEELTRVHFDVHAKDKPS
ncbi:MAG: DUF3365 domain-containing protein [Bdellovibrio sp.]|nr:DUF3365 domain-containing protein [Bdellovibrio sp.]